MNIRYQCFIYIFEIVICIISNECDEHDIKKQFCIIMSISLSKYNNENITLFNLNCGRYYTILQYYEQLINNNCI